MKRETLLITAFLIAGAISLVMSCVGPRLMESTDAAPAPAFDLAEDGASGGYDRGGGSVPPGFYQRQCQWDACQGPPSTMSTAASRPEQ